jgi:TonB family protein
MENFADGDGLLMKRSQSAGRTSRHWMVWVTAIVTLWAWPRSGVTQVPIQTAEAPIYFEFQVEQPACVIGLLGITYPAELRSAGVEGNVRFQFVVDTAGRVVENTLRAVTSSDEVFTSAGRVALLRAEFSPARIGQRKVRQLVELPIMFKIRR